MLAIAVIALAASTFIIEAMHRICVPSVTVLFETLPRLPAANLAFARIDRVLVDGVEQKAIVSARQTRVRQNQSLEIRGWAVDPATKTAAAGVFLVVDRGPSFHATYGTTRAHRGFYGVVPTAYIALGAHLVHVRVVATDLSGYYEVSQPIALYIR